MGYAWFECGDGRQVYRRIPEPVGQRSDLPMPGVMKDFDAPVQSMADGKFYTNKAALRRSYRADGNPQGIEYAEIGSGDTRTGPTRKKITGRDVATLLDKAEAKIARGEVPAARTLENT